MKSRSTGLRTKRSTCIFVITVLFSVTSLIQFHPMLLTYRRVQTPLHPNAPLLYAQSLAENVTTQRNEILTPLSTPHPVQPVSSSITTTDTIDLHDTKKEQIDRYMRRNGDPYGNKADMEAFKRLAEVNGFCESQYPTLVGGVNEGGASLKLLESCPKLKLIGFEIQATEFNVAKSKLMSYASVELHNIGWGEHEQSNLVISGTGEIAGIYETEGTGRAEFRKQTTQATVTSMAKWCDDRGIEKTNYVLIDVEGYEPKVIRGMDLSSEKNQKRFSLFQFELGGTWAAADPRHGNDWSQRAMAQYLVDRGYDLFLIGSVNWMKIHPSFFEEGPHMMDEGYGRFIQGNVLCLHRRFATRPVTETVYATSH